MKTLSWIAFLAVLIGLGIWGFVQHVGRLAPRRARFCQRIPNRLQHLPSLGALAGRSDDPQQPLAD